MCDMQANKNQVYILSKCEADYYDLNFYGIFTY